MTPGQEQSEMLANLLRLQIAAEPVLAGDPTTNSQTWMVQIRVMSITGIVSIITLDPNSARELATAIKRVAGECSVKIVPAASGPSLIHT